MTSCNMKSSIIHNKLMKSALIASSSHMGKNGQKYTKGPYNTA